MCCLKACDDGPIGSIVCIPPGMSSSFFRRRDGRETYRQAERLRAALAESRFRPPSGSRLRKARRCAIGSAAGVSPIEQDAARIAAVTRCFRRMSHRLAPSSPMRTRTTSQGMIHGRGGASMSGASVFLVGARTASARSSTMPTGRKRRRSACLICSVQRRELGSYKRTPEHSDRAALRADRVGDWDEHRARTGVRAIGRPTPATTDGPTPKKRRGLALLSPESGASESRLWAVRRPKNGTATSTRARKRRQQARRAAGTGATIPSTCADRAQRRARQKGDRQRRSSQTDPKTLTIDRRGGVMDFTKPAIPVEITITIFATPSGRNYQTTAKAEVRFDRNNDRLQRSSPRARSSAPVAGPLRTDRSVAWREDAHPAVGWRPPGSLDACLTCPHQAQGTRGPASQAPKTAPSSPSST